MITHILYMLFKSPISNSQTLPTQHLEDLCTSNKTSQNCRVDGNILHQPSWEFKAYIWSNPPPRMPVTNKGLEEFPTYSRWWLASWLGGVVPIYTTLPQKPPRFRELKSPHLLWARGFASPHGSHRWLWCWPWRLHQRSLLLTAGVPWCRFNGDFLAEG